MKILRSTYSGETPRRSIVDEIKTAISQHRRTTTVNGLKLQLEWVGPADQTVCQPELGVAIRDCLHKAICRSPRDGEINVFVLVKSDAVEVEIADEGPDCIPPTAPDRDALVPNNRAWPNQSVPSESSEQHLSSDQNAIEVGRRVVPASEFRNTQYLRDRQLSPEARVAVHPVRCPQGGVAWSIRLIARETMRKIA